MTEEIKYYEGEKRFVGEKERHFKQKNGCRDSFVIGREEMDFFASN